MKSDGTTLKKTGRICAGMRCPAQSLLADERELICGFLLHTTFGLHGPNLDSGSRAVQMQEPA
jgi:hypothetical protein